MDLDPDLVVGHVGGCTLGAREPNRVSCSCSQGLHTIAAEDAAATIRSVAWHCGWQGDPERIAGIAGVAGDVRPALKLLLRG